MTPLSFTFSGLVPVERKPQLVQRLLHSTATITRLRGLIDLLSADQQYLVFGIYGFLRYLLSKMVIASWANSQYPSHQPNGIGIFMSGDKRILRFVYMAMTTDAFNNISLSS